MRGIADAANVDYHAIRRLHMLGEITRGTDASLMWHFELSNDLVADRSMFTVRSLR